MVIPNQEAIDTFISITGVGESVAVQKLEEHSGDLNAAVNSHFSEGDRNTSLNIFHQTSAAAAQDDFMYLDDPIQARPQAPPLSLLSESRTLNPFSLHDPSTPRSFLDSGSDFMNHEPHVTQPRGAREIPIDCKDGGDQCHAPTIEDATESANAHGPDNWRTVIIDEVNEDIPAATTVQSMLQNYGSLGRHVSATAPAFDSLPDYSNDIEEEMIRAAIEASKQDAENLRDSGTDLRQSHLENADLPRTVSLSLKTTEQEKAQRQHGGEVGASITGASRPAEMELGKVATSNGRLEARSSSIQDEAENAEEQPLVRHRSRHMSSGSVDSAKEVGVNEVSSSSSPGQQDTGAHRQHNGNVFPSDEEHDEAIMLEAAMFGGIPESGYRFSYAPHQFMQPESSYPRRLSHPPSPSLEAQRQIREQQDDEYLASLQADREKELKARVEAEARHLQEEEARKATLEEERRKEEETRRKMEEEQEYERQLAAKEASLPREPAPDDENAVTLLVRMPDGSRRGRRFLKLNKLQSLFNFIDVGRGFKAGTYRLVRPYPRRAFSDGESTLTLNDLGLTSKQEALFLELI